MIPLESEFCAVFIFAAVYIFFCKAKLNIICTLILGPCPTFGTQHRTAPHRSAALSGNTPLNCFTVMGLGMTHLASTLYSESLALWRDLMA